jgi:hypothetical protein
MFIHHLGLAQYAACSSSRVMKGLSLIPHQQLQEHNLAKCQKLSEHIPRWPQHQASMLEVEPRQ